MYVPVSPSLSLLALGLLVGVGFFAGLIDAIAGGGGMLTLPALMTAGFAPHIALATNKGCSTWGTLAATLTFARAGKLDTRRGLLGFVGGACGAAFGARLQLLVAPATLKPVVLVLLAAVAIVLVLQRPTARDRPRRTEHAYLIAMAIAVLLGAYDGFFGPGTGTFVIVTHVALLHAGMSEATADAKAVNLGSNVASLIVFAFKGSVLWAVALPMGLANIAGGLIGARIAIRKGDKLIRFAVIGISLALVLKLGWELLRS